jgi:hypothetical protein
MAQHSPSFVIFSGDFLWSGDDQALPDTWDNWLKAMYEFWVTPENLMIPIIPAIGNHEIKYPPPTDYDPETDAMNYYALFNLPGNERWYSLNWGPDLRIIILDSEVLDRESETWREQMEWLERELPASEDYMWKVVVFHRDMISARSQIPRMIEDWAPVFDYYHVDLVMMGHFHAYERSHPLNWTMAPEEIVPPEEGTVYTVSGGWGAPLYTGSPQWFSAFGPRSRYHFVLIDVAENGTLHMQAVDANGKIFDEYSIHKEVSAPGGEVPVTAIVISIVIIASAVAILIGVRSRKKAASRWAR